MIGIVYQSQDLIYHFRLTLGRQFHFIFLHKKCHIGEYCYISEKNTSLTLPTSAEMESMEGAATMSEQQSSGDADLNHQNVTEFHTTDHLVTSPENPLNGYSNKEIPGILPLHNENASGTGEGAGLKNHGLISIGAIAADEDMVFETKKDQTFGETRNSVSVNQDDASDWTSTSEEEEEEGENKEEEDEEDSGEAGQDNQEKDSEDRVSKSDTNDSNRSGVKRANSQSQDPLICPACENSFSDPRLLPCLHSVCYVCLDSLHVKKNKIRCPKCKSRHSIPSKGKDGFVSNKLVMNLISAQKVDFDSVFDCAVCMLHDQTNEGYGKCIDCGDILCNDCFAKHNFSSQTAHHRVVSKDDLKLVGKQQLIPVKGVQCEQHTGEDRKFFCENCNELVCRDCILLDHSKHHCVVFTEAIASRKIVIQSLLDDLEKKREQIDDDDMDGFLVDLDKEEKKQIEIIEKVVEQYVQVMKTKRDDAVKLLRKMFRAQRKLATDRKANARGIALKIEDRSNIVNFFLDEGLDVDILTLQSVIESSLAELKEKNVSPASPRNCPCPFVIVNTGSIDFKNWSPFSISSPSKKKAAKKDQGIKSIVEKTSSKQGQEKKISKPKKKKTLPSTMLDQYQDFYSAYPMPMFMEYYSSDIPPTLVQSFPGTLQKRSVEALGGDYLHTGRQQCYTTVPFQQKIGVEEGQQNSASLNKRQAQQYSAAMFNQASFHPEPSSSYEPKTPQPELSLAHGTKKSVQRFVALRLVTCLNVKMISDNKEPIISGIAFINNETFLLSDNGNKKIKMFRIDGTFVDFFQDPAPMSLTGWNDCIAWNSDNANVYIKEHTNPQVKRLQFQASIPHPIACYKNQFIVIANVKKNMVARYDVEGRKVSDFIPTTSGGLNLQHVTSIATSNNNLIALVDTHLKRVIITNMDGLHLGEYCPPGASDWLPGDVCVDPKNSIFVTDTLQNKILMCNQRGEHIQEWTTLLEHISCIACNNKGNLLVSGKGRLNLYQYSFQ
ncbi:hypothetical protein CHS0354_036873 [Potamilus streckersoni]|uniref:Uncharacterized protein n=1 Tax=Potamilus streckersoni TaxID=2493646 RepID=A0AAE0VM93_9BIVA|nr:hypothetical protein CHS0354_036873 [Potamilus streckersoni]